MLSLIAFLIFAWIIAVKYVSSFIKSDSEKNWTVISAENTEEQKKLVLKLFNGYQNDLLLLSDKIAESQDFRKYIQRSDSKKLFEEVLNLYSGNEYQIEIYNSRLEMLAFKGRRLDSDIFTMQRCLNKNRFSVIKEIGFYTFLIIYTPIFDVKDNSSVTGIVLTSRLIDINYHINNKFFRNIGLLNDIKKASDINPVIVPANIISGKIDADSAMLMDKVVVDLTGIDGNTIGLLYFQKYNLFSHNKNIDAVKNKIISLLVFGLTVIMFLIFLKFMMRVNSGFLRFVFLVIALAAIRYVWLEFHFPSRIIDIDIFTPGYYANIFGMGIAKSLGELLITSLFILSVSIYGFKLALNKKKAVFFETGNMAGIFRFIFTVVLVGFTFIFIYAYGAAVQSIIFDSNIKLFDKTAIVPGIEQIIMNLIIITLSFSLFLILSGLYSMAVKEFFPVSFLGRRIKKYKFVLILILPFLIIFFLKDGFSDFNLDMTSLCLITILSFGFGSYLSYRKTLDNGYKIFSLRNFSVLMLFCIISVPGLLLDKIINQETRFVEIIGKKISEKEYDKLKFLLLTELSQQSESKRLETDFKNKNKLNELAFSVWAESKLSEENINSAILILDTNKKQLSDFVFNSYTLNPDSIMKFADKNYFSRKKKNIITSDTLYVEDTLTTGESFESEEELTEDESADESNIIIQTEDIFILDNTEEEYYLGIIPIQIVDLKNTQYARILGYLMTAVEYESNTFIVNSSMQLFKNYSKDNLFDKLISDPVITEYVNNEIVTSTNPDISKTGTQSLDAFRESVKNKSQKSNWRYENINNEKFRTFYIMSSELFTGNQKIISISLKRNDFKLITFFYLKFILFAVVVYMAVFITISLVLLIKIRQIKFNFREKLFVSFFIVSVIPIILLAVYTRSFIKNKYDSNFQNQIISDINLVSQALKSSKFDFSRLDTNSQNRKIILGKSQSVTDKNFNLYFKTKLYSTTNEELYKSDLLDTRVDAEAYYNIVFLKKDFFSKTEEIGIFSFITGFKPFYDNSNNLTGLMSSQTLYKQNEVNEELTEILTFIFGTYIIVIILLLVFVTFLTHRISKPILQLQNATEKIRLGENILELDNKREDEIGDLINSFNKMTKELESSKIKLMRAEREAAWRDIARRVAHEIKNPLTPMKLSIQHLYDVYFSGKNNFPDTLKKTRNIIINEIDKLNNIATEFSDFAKLTGRNYEKTILNEIIGEVISLYKQVPEIEFITNLDDSISPIWADKQELNRVFQNLIKNSIQAIEDKGIIEVKSYQKNGFVIAEITDNGSGIEAKTLLNIFDPNFSTKSTGMGLGLSITKKSLDDMNAQINFESQISKGTKVTLRFIPYNPDKDNGKT